MRVAYEVQNHAKQPAFMNSVFPRLLEGVHIENQIAQLINNASSVLVLLVFLNALSIGFSSYV